MTQKSYSGGEEVRLISAGWYCGTTGTVLKKSQIQTDGHNPYYDIDFHGQNGLGVKSVKWNWFELIEPVKPVEPLPKDPPEEKQGA